MNKEALEIIHSLEEKIHRYMHFIQNYITYTCFDVSYSSIHLVKTKEELHNRIQTYLDIYMRKFHNDVFMYFKSLAKKINTEYKSFFDNVNVDFIDNNRYLFTFTKNDYIHTFECEIFWGFTSRWRFDINSEYINKECLNKTNKLLELIELHYYRKVGPDVSNKKSVSTV